MDFSQGNSYTRRQIRNGVGGGGLQDYLPTRGRMIVAGCFRTDLNPAAPSVILPGRGPRIEWAADVLGRQNEAIPVFIKQGTNRWRYEGRYRFVKRSIDPVEIGKWKRRSGRTDVTQVVFLEPENGEEHARSRL